MGREVRGTVIDGIETTAGVATEALTTTASIRSLDLETIRDLTSGDAAVIGVASRTMVKVTGERGIAAHQAQTMTSLDQNVPHCLIASDLPVVIENSLANRRPSPSPPQCFHMM